LWAGKADTAYLIPINMRAGKADIAYLIPINNIHRRTQLGTLDAAEQGKALTKRMEGKTQQGKARQKSGVDASSEYR